jgi:hypothetical protein
MSEAKFIVEGGGPTVGPIDLDNLFYMRGIGKLDGRVVRCAESGSILTPEELEAILSGKAVQGKPEPQGHECAIPDLPIPPPVIPHAPSPVQPWTTQKLATEDPLRFVVPLNPSHWAIAAGYLGLFSVLGVFAPFALICSVLAVRDIRRNPGKTGIGRAYFGIVMGIVGLVVLGAIAVSLFNRPA